MSSQAHSRPADGFGGSAEAEPAAAPHLPRETGRRGRPDAEAVLAAVGDATYHWDLASDAIAWQSNVADVLRVRSGAVIASGTSYHLLIATEHAGARHEAIRAAAAAAGQGHGGLYRLRYRFMPAGRRSGEGFWVEDCGRWQPGAGGAAGHALGVVRVVEQRQQHEQRLQFLSEHDARTGLLNANRLYVALEKAIADAAASQVSCVLLLLSINNLPSINETFGFDVGDEVIAAVGKRLQRELRYGDSIGRLSANKFGAIINACESDALQPVVRRLMEAVRERTIVTSVTRLSSSVSVGAVRLPQHARTAEAAVAAGLDALNEARSVRHDRLVVFAPDEARLTRRRRNIATADSIMSALEENRMHVALQPIVDSRTSQPAFYECLLRLLLPDGQIVNAGEFIPVAEQLGLSRLIDHRMLELAVELVEGDPALHLSFNVSGLTTGDHDFLVQLHRLTGGNKALTRRLTVEITETTAIEDLDETVTFVDTLREIGCHVAIDDFGAGYTSFRNLRGLGADMVKIDGSFVRDITTDRMSRAFVESIAGLARSLGMTTVAEMVGDRATAEAAASMGIEYLQGYHFGRPQIVTLGGQARG